MANKRVRFIGWGGEMSEESILQEFDDVIAANFLSLEEGCVYHYTKQEGYDEISRSQYLRLNSHIVLNKKDPSNQELEVAYDLIKKRLEESDELTKKFKEYIKRGVVFYSASFSEKQSLHAQEKYGEICFEFKSSFLAGYAKDKKALFYRVEYDENKQKDIIDALFKIYNKYSRDKEKEGNARCGLFFYLTIVLPLFKHSCHKKDYECRVVRIEGFSQDGQLLTPIIAKKIDFDLSQIKISKGDLKL